MRQTPFSALLLCTALASCSASPTRQPISTKEPTPTPSAAASAAPADDTLPGFYAFVLPWDDGRKGTATDVSFLSSTPAGKNGAIVSKNGHFYEQQSGKRVRFLGVNCGAREAFPSKEDADRVAQRLAKLGVNIVRFHHLQNDWDRDGGMIWKRDKIYVELDPAQLDKLDYFVAALKKSGVYSNINLQTSRRYVPELGLPASVMEIEKTGTYSFAFMKKIDKVDRRMIELQKDYAKQLLDRKNPYTGLRYADDPAVAVVEINNENSLVGWPGESPGAGLDHLPEPFRGEIVKAWNAWLKRKYGSDATLTRAWSKASRPLGPSLFSATSEWELEKWDSDSVMQLGNSDKPGSAKSMDVTVKANAGPDWHVQAHVIKLTLETGKTYTLKFRAKADRSRNVGVGVRLHKPDWRFLGLNAEVALGTEFKDYKYTFSAEQGEAGHARLSFVVGGTTGSVSVRDLELMPGVEPYQLPKGQTLGQQNIDLPSGASKEVMDDYTTFLADTERAFAEELRKYLREDLKFKNTNIIDSQISWGGITAYAREGNMDFADAHAYWQHPSFGSKAWDAKEWTIEQKAMVNELDTSGLGTLRNLALERRADKPYTVSEYNHCAPNDFRAEQMPLIASFAALQDWDAIYAFSYGYTASKQQNDKIDGWFGQGTDPAKMALFPAAALIFRAELVAPLAESATLKLPEAPQLFVSSASAGWEKASAKLDLWKTRAGVLPAATKDKFELAQSKSETPSPVSIKRGAKGVVYSVDAPAAKILIGFVGGQTFTLGPARFTFPEFDGNFAAVTLTAVDQKPIEQSKRLLLTIVGRVENKNMQWNDRRTSVGTFWGQGPTMAQPIPVTVELSNAAVKQLLRLDGTGAPAGELATKGEGSTLAADLGRSGEASLWYELRP